MDDIFGDTTGVAPIDPTNPIRILSLSGGGYRGLFAARVLEKIEGHTKQSITSLFDLIVCTSTGSIIGAGLAVGMKADMIAEQYQKLGTDIFPDRDKPIRNAPINMWRLLKRLFIASPYRRSHLEAALKDVLDGGLFTKRLTEIEIPLVMTAVDFHKKVPVYLSSIPKLTDVPEVTLGEAIMCSSAAPTYFRHTTIGRRHLVDGGLVANTPDIVAIHCAQKIQRTELRNIKLLSIGTASPSSVSANRNPKTSALRLISSPSEGLIQLTLSAQEASAKDQAELLLGTNYHRIDAAPSPDQSKYLSKMDGSGKSYSNTLSDLADEAFQEFRKSEFCIYQLQSS